MIQRIQSVWLFVAALFSGALFISPLYRYNVADRPEVQLLSSANFFPLLLLAAIVTLVPLVTIFMFTNRRRQMRLTLFSILACLSFIGVMLMKISNIHKMNPGLTNDSYVIPGALLPVVSVIFLILAWSGIRKDDKLVKSVDRLR